MKKTIFCLVLCLILALCVGCNSSDADAVTVKIKIDCSKILDNYDLLDEELKDEKYVPSNGIILAETEVKAKAGDSAIDVLKRVCADNKIHFDDSDGYIKGINNIYEKSCGDASGWIYEVNDEPIMTEYTVSDGDLISWIYICDFSEYSFE